MLERHNTLRDNIRYAREQKNLSVKRLAELAGVGDSTIANFESRIAPRMTDRIAHQIARALGVTLEDLNDPGFRLRFSPPAQSAPALHEAINADRARLIEAFDRLGDEQRRAVLVIVEAMVGDGAKGVTYAPKR